VDRYELDDLEVLMLIAGSQEPELTALQVRRRWRYILGLAMAAQQGITLDASLPQIVIECDHYVVKAERVVAVIDEWLTQHTGQPVTDLR